MAYDSLKNKIKELDDLSYKCGEKPMDIAEILGKKPIYGSIIPIEYIQYDKDNQNVFDENQNKHLWDDMIYNLMKSYDKTIVDDPSKLNDDILDDIVNFHKNPEKNPELLIGMALDNFVRNYKDKYQNCRILNGESPLSLLSFFSDKNDKYDVNRLNIFVYGDVIKGIAFG